MNELKIESTNGGSIAKVDAGQVIIDEREKSCKMPPEASSEAKTSKYNEDYITIPLMTIPLIQNKKSNSAMEL